MAQRPKGPTPVFKPRFLCIKTIPIGLFFSGTSSRSIYLLKPAEFFDFQDFGVRSLLESFKWHLMEQYWQNIPDLFNIPNSIKINDYKYLLYNKT